MPPPPTYTADTAKIESRLAALSWTPTHLIQEAESRGIAAATVRKVLDGEGVLRSSIQKVANVLGVHQNEILSGNALPPPRKRARIVLVRPVEYEDEKNLPEIMRLLTHVAKLMDNADVVFTREGSVEIELDLSEADLERLKAAFRSGALKELGVTAVWEGVSSPEARPEEKQELGMLNTPSDLESNQLAVAVPWGEVISPRDFTIGFASGVAFRIVTDSGWVAPASNAPIHRCPFCGQVSLVGKKCEFCRRELQ